MPTDEKEAIAANKPPFFVLNHDVLLHLAHEAERIRNFEKLLPPRLSSRRKEAIIHAIAHAQNLPDSELPKKRTYNLYQPTLPEQKRFNALRQLRDRRAVELQISDHRALAVEVSG